MAESESSQRESVPQHAGEGTPPPSQPTDQTGVGDPDYARLRIDLADNWTVQDFALFLDGLRMSYLAIAYFLERLPDVAGNRLGRALATAAANHENWRAAGEANQIRSFLESESSPKFELALSAIQMNSPGWVQVLGHLNPLTVIKDYITLIRDWKTETENKRLRNEKLRLDNEKTKQDIEAKRLENTRLKAELRRTQRKAVVLLQIAKLDAEKRLLENERASLENDAKELEIERLAIDADKARTESRILNQKLVEEYLKNLERAGMSKRDSKKVAEELLLKPLQQLQPFVVDGKIRGAQLQE